MNKLTFCVLAFLLCTVCVFHTVTACDKHPDTVSTTPSPVDSTPPPAPETAAPSVVAAAEEDKTATQTPQPQFMIAVLSPDDEEDMPSENDNDDKTIEIDLDIPFPTRQQEASYTSIQNVFENLRQRTKDTIGKLQEKIAERIFGSPSPAVMHSERSMYYPRPHPTFQPMPPAMMPPTSNFPLHPHFELTIETRSPSGQLLSSTTTSSDNMPRPPHEICEGPRPMPSPHPMMYFDGFEGHSTTHRRREQSYSHHSHHHPRHHFAFLRHCSVLIFLCATVCAIALMFVTVKVFQCMFGRQRRGHERAVVVESLNEVIASPNGPNKVVN